MDHLDSSCMELRHFRHENNFRTHDMATRTDVPTGENYGWSNTIRLSHKVDDDKDLQH